MIAGWLLESEVKEFKKAAAANGQTATDLLTLLVREEIRRNKKVNGKKGTK